MLSLTYRPAAYLLQGRLDAEYVELAFSERPMEASDSLSFVNKANIKVAVVQMNLRPYRSLGDLVSHLQALVKEAQAKGAQLISFPEYVGLLPLMLSATFRELLEDFLDALEEDKLYICRDILDFFRDQLADSVFGSYYNIFALLALGSKLYIHAGTTLVRENGQLHERSFLFAPNGEVVLEQDRLFLSKTEKDLGIAPGTELEIFNSPLGSIAILAGQDSRYFEAAKAAHKLGAQLLLCPMLPAAVDDNQTYPEMADRVGPWLRCQEQACYALVSRLISRGIFQGKAGIFGPYDATRSKNGIVNQSSNSQKELVLCSRINLDYLEPSEETFKTVTTFATDSNPKLSEELQQVYEKL